MGLRDRTNSVYGESAAADAIFSALATCISIVTDRHTRGCGHYL